MKKKENHYYNRRDFLKLTGSGLGVLALSNLPILGCNNSEEPEQNRFIHFAVLADTHVIDEYYTGPEGNPLDTESILHANERFQIASDFINSYRPALELVFICGDYYHNYPSTDYNFYFENRTRVDIAKEISDGFHMPVYPGFGNHDYDFGALSREFCHNLWKDKYGLDPYYSMEHKGWKFIHINNFLGETCNVESSAYNKEMGSFGRTQLEWLEAELSQRKPSFIFLHYMLPLIIRDEFNDIDIFSLLQTYKDDIHMVIAGHTHRWIDLGNVYGPPHWVCASTRYDKDSYMIIKGDIYNNTFEILNQHTFVMGTVETEDYIT